VVGPQQCLLLFGEFEVTFSTTNENVDRQPLLHRGCDERQRRGQSAQS
jgi:hypothetical protein